MKSHSQWHNPELPFSLFINNYFICNVGESVQSLMLCLTHLSLQQFMLGGAMWLTCSHLVSNIIQEGHKADDYG